MANQQRDSQQADGPGGHDPAGLLHPLQVPEEQAQHQKQHQPQQDGTELLEQAPRRAGGRHRQRQCGEEKGDGLHFKAHAAGTAEDRVIQPHHHRQPQEGQGQHRRSFRSGSGNELHTGQHLKYRQPQKGRPHGSGPLRPALFLQRLPLRYSLGQEHQGYAAQGDGIPQLYRSGGLYALSIDLRATLGAKVIDRPGSVFSPA